MSTSLHGRLLVAAALVTVIVGSGGAAHADEVSNDLDATVGQMGLVVGTNGSTTIHAIPTGRPDDPLQGCNIRGNGAYLEVGAASSDSGIATVSLTDSRIEGCDLEDGVPLVVRPVAPGTATVTLSLVSLVSNNVTGTFNFAPATFTVTVTAPANTAPRVQVAGAEDGGVYQLGGYSPELAASSPMPRTAPAHRSASPPWSMTTVTGSASARCRPPAPTPTPAGSPTTTR